MEHRNSERLAVEMQVRLYKDDTLVVLAKASDITPNGMYISTNALTFPIGSTWKAVFDFEHTSKRIKVPVKVVRRSLDGIGVKFERADLDLMTLSVLSMLDKEQYSQPV